MFKCLNLMFNINVQKIIVSERVKILFEDKVIWVYKNESYY